MCSLCPYLVVKCHYYLKGSVMNAMCIKNYKRTYKRYRPISKSKSWIS